MDTILVIDDSMLICNIVEKTLINSNLNVLKAYTGQAALSLIKETRPNLILLDLMLPDIDGYSVCQLIKNDPLTSDIPVIFLTSQSDEKSLVMGFKVGAIDYISKPFSTIELIVRINSHLDNKKTKDALRKANIELEKALEENKILAYTDKLTGLYNRHYFLENIYEFVNESKYSDSPLFIALFDIDNFKKINDVYGHFHGDCVLASISSIIKHNLSNCGIMCRWGGEEFVSCIYGINKNDLEEKIQNICTEVANYNFGKGEIDIFCTITVGISNFDCALNIDENINLADRAMYTKKHNGKNGYYFCN